MIQPTPEITGDGELVLGVSDYQLSDIDHSELTEEQLRKDIARITKAEVEEQAATYNVEVQRAVFFAAYRNAVNNIKGQTGGLDVNFRLIGYFVRTYVNQALQQLQPNAA